MGYKRVLVVDDEQSIRDILKRALEFAGHETSTANTARAAIEQLQGQSVDVVITDILMPDMDGLELLRFLRTEFPDVGVIAMSGHDDLYLAMARKLGAFKAFSKPFHPLEVLEAVKSFCPSSGVCANLG